MVCGYVFISTDLGEALRVMEEVSKIENIKSACAVTGVFDIIAHFNVEKVSDIGTVVVDKVHSIQGVVETQTAISVKCFGESCEPCE